MATSVITLGRAARPALVVSGLGLDLQDRGRPPVEDADPGGEVIEDTEITGTLWKLDFFGRELRMFDRRRNVFALDPQAHPLLARPVDRDNPGGAKEPNAVLLAMIDEIRKANLGAFASGFLSSTKPTNKFLQSIFDYAPHKALTKGRMNDRFTRDKGQVIATFKHPIRGGRWAIFLRIVSPRMWEFRIDHAPSSVFDTIKDLAAYVVEVVGDVFKDLLAFARDLACSTVRTHLQNLEVAARAKVELDTSTAGEISRLSGMPISEINAATTNAAAEPLRRIGNRLLDRVCSSGDGKGSVDTGQTESPTKPEGLSFGVKVAIGGSVLVGGGLLVRALAR